MHGISVPSILGYRRGCGYYIGWSPGPLSGYCHGDGSLLFLLQIVDDILDFKSTQACVGKPTAVDLRLGLATAPVLYAARKVNILTGYYE